MVEPVYGGTVQEAHVQDAKIIIMKKLFNSNLSKLLLTQITFLFIISKSLCQNNLNFEFIDSISISVNDINEGKSLKNGYQARLFNNLLFVFTYRQNLFYTIDLNNHKVSSYHFEVPSNASQTNIEDYYVTSNTITTINYAGNEIQQFDWNGNLKRKIKPKMFFSKYHIKPFTNLIFNESANLFYVPIALKFREQFIISKPKKAKNYYNRHGLIGVFDNKGKLMGKLGVYDSLYQTDFYTHSDQYYFTLNAENKVILSQQLSHKIQALCFDDRQEINFKGRYINKLAKEIPTSKSLNKEEQNTNRILSYNYGKVGVLNSSGLTFRYYKLSSIDTTTFLPVFKTENVDNAEMCKAPNQRELNQNIILNDKNLYLQIIDLKNSKVYFDNLFPFKGNYIYSNINNKKNEIFTGKLTLNEIKLYRYRLIN